MRWPFSILPGESFLASPQPLPPLRNRRIHACTNEVVGVRRFTPTPVGNAVCRRAGVDYVAVHPHACGECDLRSVGLRPGTGSPPRLWGMQYVCGSSSIGGKVHPHACGECVLTRCATCLPYGSPPHLWGMLSKEQGNGNGNRFTPTPVGNASWLWCSWRSRAVHPHACGECLCCLYLPRRNVGSPPRLWGMLAKQFLADAAGNFTPTPVGNAYTRLFGARGRMVHPHACGECSFTLRQPVSGRGSPPRLWGMLRQSLCWSVHLRFTLTPVGNASYQGGSTTQRPVHPHACGECALSSAAFCAFGGSPSRLWGMPYAALHLYKAVGSPPRLWGMQEAEKSFGE